MYIDKSPFSFQTRVKGESDESTKYLDIKKKISEMKNEINHWGEAQTKRDSLSSQP